MKTRNLLIAAFLCGLAILVAGGLQLFRLARNPQQVVVHRMGDAVVVSGVEVAPLARSDTASATLVQVRLRNPGSSSTTVAADAWALLVGGEVRKATTPTGPAACGASELAAGATTECTVAFERAVGPGTLSFSRGGKQAQWAVPAA